MTAPTADTRFGRRTFLEWGAAAAVGATAGLAAGALTQPAAAEPPPVRTRPRADPATRSRAVVIGAGLAGLTCAVALQDQGWDVTVLEARERVGGRVHTLWEPFGPGSHVEGGAELVDRDHHVILGLLRRFGIGTEERDRSLRSAIVMDGRRTDYDRRADRRGGDLRPGLQVIAEATARLADTVDPQAPERSRHAERLDATSLAEWADALPVAPLTRRVWELDFVVSDYGSSSSNLSLLFYAQQECFGSSNPDVVEALRIKGGNSLLPLSMAVHLGPSRVRTGQPVTSVSLDGDVATVRTSTGEQLTAAQVVLACPPPTMRDMRIDGPLPGELRQAIDSTVLDPITKVAIPYVGHPWRAAGWTGESVSDLAYTYSWDATDSRPGRRDGVLMAFTAGPYGVELTALPAGERIRRVADGFGRAFPETVGAIDTEHPAATVAWAREKYTQGGYVNYRPGQMLTGKPAFRRAYGPLRFVGEHTEASGQYMESAAASGRRVAHSIGPAPRRLT